LMSALIAFAS